jgi:hypothetical protein
MIKSSNYSNTLDYVKEIVNYFNSISLKVTEIKEVDDTRNSKGESVPIITLTFYSTDIKLLNEKIKSV